MSDDVVTIASWIAGLMRENYEAVGFLPETGVLENHVRHGRYVLQTDEAGRRIGYLLYGALIYGLPLRIAQHCIQDERRRQGYGETALSTLIQRAESVGAASIQARVATDLDSLGFWLSQSFRLRDIVPGGERRGRKIARLWLPLTPPLFPEMDEDPPCSS